MYFFRFKVATDKENIFPQMLQCSVVLTVANPYVQNSTIVLVTVCVWRPSSVNLTWDTMARTAVTTVVKQLITVRVSGSFLG